MTNQIDVFTDNPASGLTAMAPEPAGEQIAIEKRTIIVKLAERCNLACPYCYMYSDADQSWRKRPKRLSAEHVDLLIDRTAELLRSDPGIHVIMEFHGGEPLLFPMNRFADMITRMRAVFPDNRMTYCLQTNGVLLNEDWCALFAANKVHWSISCDGPKAVHDRFRPDHAGRGSHAATERAIRLSLSRPEWRRMFGGVLAVIDPGADAGEIVRYFHDLEVKDFDLLLPDATHVTPPSHLPDFSQDQLIRFLSDAFDAWTALDDPKFHLRIFEHMMRSFIGLSPELDAFGGGVDWIIVVESDGSYQLLDVLHICGEDQTVTGGSLENRSLEAQFRSQCGVTPGVCETCAGCPVLDICGGGYLPHRFNGIDFDTPSVHCDALYSTISTIQRYLEKNTPAHVWSAVSSTAA